MKVLIACEESQEVCKAFREWHDNLLIENCNEKEFISKKELIEWLNNNNSKFEGKVFHHNGKIYNNESYRIISLKELMKTLGENKLNSSMK